MGQSASQEELESVGYRVLGVQPNSPAASAGLVSFFDFVVAANGEPLKVLDQRFVEMIKSSENKPLPLTIFNIKSETTRDVVITPRRNWGGQGMLGVTIRFDSFWRAEEALVRVLEVQPDSPAELAGLEPEKDYLLGTAEKVFKDTETLNEEVVKFLDSTVEFYVYNTATDEVRVVVVMPTHNWDGQGCLGLSVGHGFLHRLPHRCKQSTGRSIEPARAIFPTSLSDATAGPPAQEEAAPAEATPVADAAPQVPMTAATGGANGGEPSSPSAPAPACAPEGGEGSAGGNGAGSHPEDSGGSKIPAKS
eukprot:CAMPEP_0172582432 /NCGR_PEP_ID=MMETSP1068-20121228/1835_1 /TAXON_ID=35684 /ORGANISM="Pseudopedinella elastica, Strain CCMP716" /LENGTH=306 /DNA_ID=CAMNT_0013375777 /DNA_START=179 /DNA_END=1099 /DNA_ORIENTATION=-